MARRVPRPDTKPVHLSRQERRKLEEAMSRGLVSARTQRRVRALILLAEGWAPVDVPGAVGCGEATVRRVRQRHESGGIDSVLEDRPQRGRPRAISAQAEARIVAMVCGPPPEGCNRWTINLVAERAIAQGIVQPVCRESIRLVLRDHDLRPWRKKNVVRAGA